MLKIWSWGLFTGSVSKWRQMVQGGKTRWWAEQAWWRSRFHTDLWSEPSLLPSAWLLPSSCPLTGWIWAHPGRSTAKPLSKAQHQTHTDITSMAVLVHQLRHASPAMGCSLCVTAPRPGRHQPHSQSRREAVMHHSCVLSGGTAPTHDAFDPSAKKNPHTRRTFDAASNSIFTGKLPENPTGEAVSMEQRAPNKVREATWQPERHSVCNKLMLTSQFSQSQLNTTVYWKTFY